MVKYIRMVHPKMYRLVMGTFFLLHLYNVHVRQHGNDYRITFDDYIESCIEQCKSKHSVEYDNNPNKISIFFSSLHYDTHTLNGI